MLMFHVPGAHGFDKEEFEDMDASARAYDYT